MLGECFNLRNQFYFLNRCIGFLEQHITDVSDLSTNRQSMNFQQIYGKLEIYYIDSVSVRLKSILMTLILALVQLVSKYTSFSAG